MKKSLTDLLCCPVTQQDLELRVFEAVETGTSEQGEIESGVLLSTSGFMFPIIKGVPRLLVESFIDHEDFLRRNLLDFEVRSAEVWKNHRKVITDCIKRNQRTKRSFALEWNTFCYRGDTTWGFDKAARIECFLRDVDAAPSALEGVTLIDVGCGNGVLTAALAELGARAIGMDLSDSVVRAHEHSGASSAHFVQGDLQLPPFRREAFDIVYSWGVIHHTNNTELSFSCLHELVSPGGVLFVWVYHPLDDWKANLFFSTRRLTHRLPLRLQLMLYSVVLLPVTYVMLALKRTTKFNWREQMVDLLDGLTPDFRFEHTQDEVSSWYVKRGYSSPRVTTVSRYGFGICASKRS